MKQKKWLTKGDEIVHKGFRLVYLGRQRFKVYAPDGRLLVHDGSAGDCKIVIQCYLSRKK